MEPFSLYIIVDPARLQVYVFHTATLKAVLAANEKLTLLEEQLIPHMVRYQLKPRRSVGDAVAAGLARSVGASRRHGSSASMGGLEGSFADLSISGMSGGSGGGGAAGSGGGGTGDEWYCCAYLAPEGSFCQRANTLQGFADVNRWGGAQWGEVGWGGARGGARGLMGGSSAGDWANL